MTANTERANTHHTETTFHISIQTFWEHRNQNHFPQSPTP